MTIVPLKIGQCKIKFLLDHHRRRRQKMPERVAAVGQAASCHEIESFPHHRLQLRLRNQCDQMGNLLDQ